MKLISANSMYSSETLIMRSLPCLRLHFVLYDQHAQSFADLELSKRIDPISYISLDVSNSIPLQHMIV